LLDLHTMLLRSFGTPAERDTAGATRAPDAVSPVLVVAPYAGHSSTIADLHKGQSLVQTLLAQGLPHVLVTDWKSATAETKDYEVDQYLAELNVCVDDLCAAGGRVHLVGLCQGGWMSAMYAARFPGRVQSLVLAGSPIDTHAGDGELKQWVERTPPGFFDEMIALGGGLMRGRVMLRGWKNMHPEQQYVGKYLELYQRIDEPGYVARTEAFESWYENPIDLPGRWYLQVVNDLFRENKLAQGRYVGLGRTLSLRDIRCPLYLLAGDSDDITTREQVFAARGLVGTDPARIVQTVAPGGHIGLFMGGKTLRHQWPVIGQWIREADAGWPPT
jgi:poly(3-hydroxybutyrate) depolymerase